MIGAIVVLSIVFGTLLYCELTDPNSWIRCRLWCRKHGLKLKERPGPECATFWSGEDGLGNEYAPGEDGEPVKIKEGGDK